MAQAKRNTQIVGPKSSPIVKMLLRNFDRAHPGERKDFEGVLLEQISLAEKEGRVSDSIALKQRLLQLRAGR